MHESAEPSRSDGCEVMLVLIASTLSMYGTIYTVLGGMLNENK